MKQTRLVPLEERHLPKTFQWLSNQFVAENLGLRKKPRWDYTLQWHDNAKPENGVWAFAILHGTIHAGNLVLDRLDETIRSIRLFLFIGPLELRGKGIAFAAIQSALEFAFNHLDLNKVWLQVHERNLGAIRLYQRVGFNQEGLLKDEFIFRGELINMLQLAVLKKEFLHRRAG